MYSVIQRLKTLDACLRRHDELIPDSSARRRESSVLYTAVGITSGQPSAVQIRSCRICRGRSYKLRPVIYPTGQPAAVLIRSSRISRTFKFAPGEFVFGASMRLPLRAPFGHECAPGNYFEPGVRTKSLLSSINKKAPKGACLHRHCHSCEGENPAS